MSELFAPSGADLSLDPRKRVRYSTGLVLGLDEFLQEQTYFLEKHRAHARGLHGYGVVCGLDVASRGDPDPEIVVSPGIALNPRGQTMTVDQDYCLRVNAWLERHRDEVEAAHGSPLVPLSPDLLPLYLVLCHRECETDIEPIPSGPCQSLDKVTAPTRVADDFVLELRFEPPDQTEEDAIRALGALLRSIEIAPGPTPLLTEEELLDMVRALGPGSPGPADGSPGTELRVHPDDAEAFLRSAMELWVSEVRPALLPDGRNCHCGPPRESCVLLAEIGVPLALVAGTFRVDGALEIGTGARPILLQTRLLQERLGFGSGAGGGIDDHGALDGLGDDDHSQYLLVDDTTRALIADLNAGGNRVTSLAAGTGSGDAVEFDQAVKVGDAAGGDLSFTYPNPRVDGLRGRPLGAQAPSTDDVLTWTGSRWQPRPLPPSSDPGPSNFEPELTRLRALSWPHSGITDYSLLVDGSRERGVAVLFTRPVEVRPGSLDFSSFQIFVELGSDGLIQIARGAAFVEPVRVRGTNGDLITEVEIIGETLSDAALLRFEPKFLEGLEEVRAAMTRIVIHGDVVIDETGRAIDAELLRAKLPGGDRPHGSEVGLQGGRFESWAAFRANQDSPLEVNLASESDLMTLAGVNPAGARGIIALRNERGRIRSIEELAEASGVSRRLANSLRDRLIIR